MLPLMQTSIAFAPSPTNDSFASFLAKLAALPEGAGGGGAGFNEAEFDGFEASAPEAAEADPLEDLSLLSYESALRAPVRRQSAPAAKAADAPSPTLRLREPKAIRKAPSFPAFFTKKNGKTQPSTALQTAQPRIARTTVRLTVEENDLLHTRATESGLTVASYIRACIFEVESLRAEVRNLSRNQARQTASAPRSPQPLSVDSEPLALPQTPTQPVFATQPKQPLLGGSQAPRPLQPVSAHPPQPAARPRHYDPRVQAAIEAERIRNAMQNPSPTQPSNPEAKRGLFGFLFGSRRRP